MRGRKRASPAASVFRQAQERFAANGVTDNDSPVAWPHLGSSWIDESPDPQSGKPRLRVVLTKGKGRKYFDFSILLHVPAWTSFLIAGFQIRSETISFTSSYTEFGILCRLSSFLREVDQRPDQVDEAFWGALVAWLNSPRVKGEPLAPKTRQQYLGVFQLTVSALLENPEYRSLSEHILYRSGFPVRPWPASSRKTIPSPVLRPEQRLQIVQACLVSIEEIRQRYEEDEALIRYGEARLAMAAKGSHAPLFEDIGVCAAALDDLTDDRVLSVAELRNLDSSLMSAIGKKHGGIGEIRKMLYATNGDLVPFVILLAVVTAFNPSTVLGLVWSNIRDAHDEKRISITGRKPRAGTAQTSTHEADLPSIDIPAEQGVMGGLSDILQLLRSITERTRRLAAPSERDFLFVAVQLHAQVKVSTFFSHQGLEARITPKAFNDFRERFRLPNFSLRMLRATEAEVEYQRTGDILAVKDRMGHKSARITRTHYTSGWVRSHGQDRIGATQELVVRWASTGGKSDPRGLKDPRDAPGATRGFGCLDPYDSPRTGQRSGRLCSAYGECPSCPLMLARPRDPQSAAHYLALRNAIVEGKRGVATGVAWVERWAPVLHDLESLIREIPENVMERATLFRVSLPPVA
ncbi:MULTISPECIES: hypothetical protein [Thioclava]|uniref:hypothetical protein n=1 Tax=Thioclava TaxID=285107 RepID=UPI0011324320|nr:MULTISPECIES: hypothetical protein [Thioclava]MBC7146554.1 hypothetical protein [Thioclava marina]